MTTSATNSPLFTSKQRVTGLANGAFDTKSIVEQLMAIERQPYDKLDIKRQTEQFRLQAYQALNSFLLNFRSSVSTLSSRTLWNAKTTSSSNEKSLTATANDLAVKGSYSFKVAQLANAAQFRSKGVADSKAPLAPAKKIIGADGKEVDAPPEKIGTINLASGKTRVDNSAKLEQLNGGKGVFRGSVRITDSNNGSANVDLSACITLDDVVRTLNSADGVRINATMRDGRIHIQDEAGGSSTLKIQNVGTGTTATDLGIAGSSVDENGDPTDFIHGRNVFTLGRDTSLAMLNDGLGVEEGTFGMRIYGQNDPETPGQAGESAWVEIAVNIDDCKTVGQVIDRVNKEIENLRANGFANPSDNRGGANPDEILRNLRFGVSADGRSFGFTGVTDANSFVFFDRNDATMVGQATPAAQLGLTGESWEVAQGAREISFGRVLGDANSPMLKNLGGSDGFGVGSYPPEDRIPVAFNKDTKISALNGGTGLDTTTGLQFILLEGGKDANGVDATSRADMNIISDVLDMGAFRTWLEEDADGDATNGRQEHTVEDLVNYLNTAIADYAADPSKNGAGLSGMTFELDGDGTDRLVIKGVQAGYSVQIAGGVAASLGLTRARAANGDIGSAIELDPDLDAELQAAVDKFYGTGDNGKDIRADGNTKDITLSGDEATKLGDLADWASIFGAGEGVTLRLADARNDKGTDDPSDDEFGFDYGADGIGDPLEVKVRWDQLKDEDGNLIVINEDTDLGALVAAMNRAIEDGFHAADGGGQPYDYAGHVPQLRVNSLANGLQWSNMDFNAKYWEMEGMGSGGGMEALNLERSFADNAALATAVQMPSMSAKRLDPKAIGYVDAVDLTADNADTVKVGDLNFGMGLSLSGDETEAFTIEFAPNTAADGDASNAKAVSFTRKELQDAVQGFLDGWNGDPANAGNPKADVNDLTVEQYMGVLNRLVDDKIEDYYTTVEPGVAADDRFSMEFKVGDGVFAAGDIENAEGLTLSGFAGDMLYDGVHGGLASGISPSRYTKEQIDAAKTAGTDLVVNNVAGTTGKLVEQTIDGLGEIAFTLDGDDDFDDIFRLNTAGIGQNSTLNDLINTLNDQLARMGSDSADPQYNARLKDVRFKLNDSGTGIALDNGSNARITFIDTFALRDPSGDPDDPANRLPDAQHLAQDLGLVGADGSETTVEAYSQYNAGSLGRHYISRATSLETFMGKNVDYGSITITNAGGATASIPLSGAKTIGDVIDAINGKKGFGVFAEINATGDGIILREQYEAGAVPSADDRKGQISVMDEEGGSGIAKKLGIAGAGKRDNSRYAGASVIGGRLTTSIDVMSTDSLEDIMYRISEAGYKTAIINDGQFQRLTVSATNTGEANDFVIDSDVEALGFTQTYRGQDAKVLHGDPNATASPLMISSATNSNSNAILGITLDVKAVSSEWTTITVDDDKEAVTEAVKAMVAAYNEMADVVRELDAYDSETGEEGIFFGDNNVRTLMDDISEFFYQIYNPNNAVIGSVDKDNRQQTWTWMDLGINLSATPTNADGTGGWYNKIDLDEEKLSDMVSSNWDVLSKMLWNENNVASASADKNVRPTVSFNGDLEDGFSLDGAINGNTSKSSFGPANGIQAKDTIENGDNQFTLWFQRATNINRMTIYFPSAEDSLKDFTVEYLDAATGQWKQLRHTDSNNSDYVPYGFMTENVNASALRITAKETNADDGKFRLLDVQIFEQSGLAGKMNQHTTTLGDTQQGFLASMNTEIQESLKEIEDQMQRLQEKLTAKEESMWRRFSTMETAMSKLKGQGDYFSNMMKSLGGSSS